MNIKNKYLISSVFVFILLIILSYGLFVNSKFFQTKFNYKFPVLKEQKKEITSINNNINTIKQNIENKKNVVDNYNNEYSLNTNISGFDEASLLIYIENKSLSNKVYIEKINVNKNDSSQNETKTQPQNTISKKIITDVIVHGSYQNIENFIKNLNDDIGKYNYINFIHISRGEQSSLNDKNEKNIICNLKIEINYN